MSIKLNVNVFLTEELNCVQENTNRGSLCCSCDAQKRCCRPLVSVRVGVMDYIMLYYWREFNLAIFYDSPNRQIKVLAKFSGYTVLDDGELRCFYQMRVDKSFLHPLFRQR